MFWFGNQILDLNDLYLSIQYRWDDVGKGTYRNMIFPSYFNISTGNTSILHVGASNHHGNNFNKIQSGYEFSIIVIMTYARWYSIDV